MDASAFWIITFVPWDKKPLMTSAFIPDDTFAVVPEYKISVLA
jgi:hypothetical protein